MKKYLILILVIGLHACHKEKRSEFDQLMEETMEIHDGDMKRMGELMKLKSDLKKAVKTAEPSRLIELKTALDELETADQQMMQWMRNFSRIFPDGAMSHEGMNHQGMNMVEDDHSDHNMQMNSNHSSHGEMSDLEKLKAQRVLMDSMRAVFNNSLDRARQILNQ